MAKAGKRKKQLSSRKPVSKRYLIASEGKKTEKNYFDGLVRSIVMNNQEVVGRVRVEDFEVAGIGSSTLRLINDIEKYLSRSPNMFESVWAVFDMDDFPKDQFDNAIASAEARGWQAAWSNDCFELWLLLHFEYLNSAISREQYKRKLTGHLQKLGIQKYEKNSVEIMAHFYPKSQLAIKNAKKLAEMNGDLQPHDCNPGTNIHGLVEELLEL